MPCSWTFVLDCSCNRQSGKQSCAFLLVYKAFCYTPFWMIVLLLLCIVMYCIVMYCTVCSYFLYCCEEDALHGSLLACIHILVPIQLLNWSSPKHSYPGCRLGIPTSKGRSIKLLNPILWIWPRYNSPQSTVLGCSQTWAVYNYKSIALPPTG